MPDHERKKSGLIWSDDSYDRYRAPFYDHDWDDTLSLSKQYPSGIDKFGKGIWNKVQHRGYHARFGVAIPARVLKGTFHFGPSHIRITLRKTLEQNKPIEDWDKFLKDGAYKLASPEFEYACYGKWGTGIKPPRKTFNHQSILLWDDKKKP